MKESIGIALCIPLYYPSRSFFENLSSFLEKNQISELVIIETLEDFSKSNFKEQIDEIARSRSVKLIYGYCGKSDFRHGNSRNNLFKNSSSQYVIFTTQDTIFANTIKIEELVHKLSSQDLDGICVRHFTNSQLFTKVFDGMFSNLSSIDYTSCASESILWWSHNFVIYKRSAIEALPFPDISFAEDLYWAKSARTRGMRLRIDFSQGVRHQNIDKLQEVLNRGKLEARGHFEGHLLSYYPRIKFRLLPNFLSITFLSIKLISKLRFGTLLLDVKLARNTILQQCSYVFKWNSLVDLERKKLI